MSLKKHKIHAIHDYNLKEFLKNIGLLEAIEEGELRCSICGSVIDKDNFQCAYPLEGRIEVCCDKLECFQGVLERRKKQKVV